MIVKIGGDDDRLTIYSQRVHFFLGPQYWRRIDAPATALFMPWLQVRFDYDTPTIRLRRIARACLHSTPAKNEHVKFSSRIAVESNAKRNLITFVVVECAVVSSYRIVVS